MVYFVGAGTGAPDLITVRGMRLLQQADRIIYAGSLVNPELLEYAGPDCLVYDSAKLTLEEVLELIRQGEEQGETIVRLHTGDPSIYGAVREQMDALDELGIPYESCPGVSACFGAAASLNLEYTLPGVSQSLIITRMEGKTKVPAGESIRSFASHQASMAIYLSTGLLEQLSKELIAGGYEPDTPAAIVYKATWPEEKACICTVETLQQTAAEQGIHKTALVLVGEVLLHRKYEKSRLYAPDFSTEFRQGKKTEAFRGGDLSVISFTEKGLALSERIAEIPGWDSVKLYTGWSGYRKKASTDPAGGSVVPLQESVTDWAGRQMKEKRTILFVGACGIAVRAIAPFVADKLTDSPVLVMDEKGQYIIPVLSGHLGGANRIAMGIAADFPTKPVITTATDVNQCFAVDLFAQEHQLSVVNREGIAAVSAKALAGQKITVSCQTCQKLDIENMDQVPYPPSRKVDVLITSEKGEFDASLILRPREYVIGIGCRKDTDPRKLEAWIRKNLEEAGLEDKQIALLASIDVKKEEEGLKLWAADRRIPFRTFTARELTEIPGDFTGSDFVKKQVGVDNVCERAALAGCGAGGQLIYKKHAGEGMTIAIARKSENGRSE